ncbi:hypothetical protein ACWDYH_35765 [Nocardia goodfellowii]
MARAFAEREDDVAAVLTLGLAASICGEDPRFDPVAHRTMQSIIGRGNLVVQEEVVKLAAIAGLKR